MFNKSRLIVMVLVLIGLFLSAELVNGSWIWKIIGVFGAYIMGVLHVYSFVEINRSDEKSGEKM